jgi:hypothetical protein
MQLQSRPTSSFLTFERDIVRDSRAGGVRQLAAAGFYHCLGECYNFIILENVSR